jgi:hypothetical protein
VACGDGPVRREVHEVRGLVVLVEVNASAALTFSADKNRPVPERDVVEARKTVDGRGDVPHRIEIAGGLFLKRRGDFAHIGGRETAGDVVVGHQGNLANES